MTYEKQLSLAKRLVKEAGDLLLDHQRALESLVIKSKEAQGIVSNADLESEQFIVSEIHKAFPDDAILGEEASFENIGFVSSNQVYLTKYKNAEKLWIIDPLDGTNNYLSRFDYFAVCIGYMENNQMKMGVVYRPTTGEIFEATIGNGCFKDNLLRPVERKNLYIGKTHKVMKDSIFATGFAREKGISIEEEIDYFKNIMIKCRAVRRVGSAALDMCYVAEGIFDGFWEANLAPWDMAASGIICLESGIRIQDFERNTYSPFNDSIVAAREPLFEEIIQLL